MRTKDDRPIPPVDGSVFVLPGLIDWQAQHNPGRECFIWSSSARPHHVDGVTYKEFCDASHRLAHILRPNRAGPEGEVVGLLMNTDALLYGAVIAGMARAGMVVRAIALQRLVLH